MKFRVAGGPSGDAGIEVAGRRYEPGDEVDLSPKQSDWLVEQGYVVALGKEAPAPKLVSQEAKPAADDKEEN